MTSSPGNLGGQSALPTPIATRCKTLRRRSIGALALLLGLAMLGLAGSVSRADDAKRVLFTNSVGPLTPEAAATVRALRPENLADTMEIEIPLRIRDLPKLRNRVSQGQTMAPADLARNYFPAAADYEALRAWLVAQGFTITTTDSNRLAIFARGTVGQIQQSFQVAMSKVTVKGVDYYAAQTHPSLPAEIAAPVLAVNGLQPYLRPHTKLIRPKQARLGPVPAIDDEPPFLVSEVLGAYNATNLGVTGSGQTIAILIDSVPASGDLTGFWNANNIPQSLNNIEEVNVTGSLPIDTEGEATLDVEWSSGVAPGAVIRIYATGDLSFTSIDKALDKLINDLTNPGNNPNIANLHQLSISLGLGETYLEGTGETTTESGFFATIAGFGVSIFVASGDAGSNPDSTGHNPADEPGPLQVEYEASDPSVTGVGGTNLYLDFNGNVTNETGWDGSGGGISQIFQRPIWQTGTGVPAGTMRCVPDVSSVASDTTYAYFYFQGEPSGVAGTSWATPTWAGFCTLMNQARFNNALQPFGLLNPLIYPLIGTNNFRDITSGSNGAYTAGVGYDLVTGIGTPNVTNLLITLAGSPSSAPFIISFSPTGGPPATPVVINGLNFASATGVAFNGAAAASFTVDSATQITAVVPTGATTGKIAVTSPQGTGTSNGPFTVLPNTPANDNFANAQVVAGNSGTVIGSNFNATLEFGEPQIPNNVGGHSIWYSWTAPTTDIFTFDTYGSSFDTVLAVYTGSSVTALTLVGYNDDAGSGVTSALSFPATQGTTYRITVDGSDGAEGTVNLDWSENDVLPVINNFIPGTGSPGAVVVIDGGNFTGTSAVQFGAQTATTFTVLSATQISATVPAGATTGSVSVTTPAGTGVSTGVFTVNSPPANDNFVNATILSGNSGTVTGTNIGATKEHGEPNHAGNVGGHSVWYSWTPTVSGNVNFNTFGSSFDTLLAAYTGSTPNGPATVNNLTPVASNDNIGTSITSSISFAAQANTIYYIAVDGAGGVVGGIVLNYASNIAAPAVTGFDPISGGGGTSVTLTGTAFTSATAVQFNGTPATFGIVSDTQISTTVPAGATTGPISVIDITGTGASSTDFTVSAAPGNDDFASAYTFTGTGAVTGTNVGATKEPGEPDHAGNAGGASVWWMWVAPSTADYAISTLGSNFNTLLAVYTGSSVSTLTAIASNDNDPNGGETSLVLLHAIAQTTYYIAVDGFNGATGQITLSILPPNGAILFSTGFETAENYTTASPLAGQNGWMISGTGGNGILNNVFDSLGQQAYIGTTAPTDGTFTTTVWHPITYTATATDQFAFQVIMQVTASTNGTSSVFGWTVRNQVGNTLFTLLFDNTSGHIGYQLDDGNGTRDTGFTFDNQTIYALSIDLNIAANSWNAGLNGTTIVASQPLTTASSTLNLGDIDATWLIDSAAPAGNDSMIFDNYSITNTGNQRPQIILDPQPQTVPAGSTVTFSVVASGTQPITYQWQKNQQNLLGQTGASLTLTNVQSGDGALYDVVVTNSIGPVTSLQALLTVTPTDLPDLTPVQPAGWTDRIVVTNQLGSTIDDTQLKSIDSLYVDWAIINVGLEPAPAGFQNALYVDGVLVNTWTQATALAPNAQPIEIIGYPIGMLAAGLHTIEIVADSTNVVAESNEGNNTYTKQIFVSNPVGYHTITATVAPAAGGAVAGTGSFQPDTKITLTATPATGYKFVSWTTATGTASKSAAYTFTPTASESFVANFVSIASDAPPAITISIPTTAATFGTLQSSISLAGTASSGAGVKQVTWAVTGGKSGHATGTTTWSASKIPLQPGNNVLTLTVLDKAGQQASAVLQVSSVAAATFAGSYSGLLEITQPLNPTYIGFAQMTVTANASLTGTIWFHGVQFPFHGAFSPAGTYSTLLAPSSSSSVAVNLTLSPGASPVISGTVTSLQTTATITAEPAVFNAHTNPWNQPGTFTMVFQPDPQEAGAPAGSGIGFVKVTTAGVVKVTGKLPDGIAFSGGGSLPQSGIWPFFASLYSSHGAIAGPVTFRGAAANPNVAGLADWTKEGRAPGTHYLLPIQERLAITGSLFTAPKSPALALKPGTRTVTLANGDLPETITDSVSLLAKGVFGVTAPNDGTLKLQINPASGLVSGSFIHTVTGKSVSITGIALQQQDTAYGFFLGPTDGGSFELSTAP